MLRGVCERGERVLKNKRVEKEGTDAAIFRIYSQTRVLN